MKGPPIKSSSLKKTENVPQLEPKPPTGDRPGTVSDGYNNRRNSKPSQVPPKNQSPANFLCGNLKQYYQDIGLQPSSATISEKAIVHTENTLPTYMAKPKEELKVVDRPINPPLPY